MNLYQRNGKWVAVIELGKDDFGKRKQKWLTGRTKAEARAKGIEIEHKVQSGQYVAKTRDTLGEWLDYWIKNAVLQKAPATVQSYRDSCVTWKTRLGEQRLTHLTPMMVQQVMAELLNDGMKASTVKHRLGVLRMALKHAVAMGKLYRDPTTGVQAPTVKNGEVQTVSAEKLREIIEASRTSKYHLPVLLAATTGMRRGEVLGLEWQDIDLEAGEIWVRRQYSADGLGPLKTEGSARRIPIPPETVAALKAEHKAQAELKLSLGRGYSDGGLVCCNERGLHYTPRALTAAFTVIAEKAQAPISFHGLRSTHATLLLAAGVPMKVVQERLGHTSAALTLGKYAGVTPSMQWEAVRTLELVMGTGV